MNRLFCFLSLLLVYNNGFSRQIAVEGQPLPAWKEGYLDLHHINTGNGDAACYIFPDGTSMLLDAGENVDPNDKRAGIKFSAIRPDNSRRAYEWIAYYIQQVHPRGRNATLDYALITHFDGDHFGAWYPTAPKSPDGQFSLSGIMGVGALLPIGTMLDRGYPGYSFPRDMYLAAQKAKDSGYRKTLESYRGFLNYGKARGMTVAPFKAGSKTQISLRQPEKFPGFYVQNIKVNGKIWTGRDSSVIEHFTQYNAADPKTWPDENSLSAVLAIHYGPFVYYTGGDCAGNLSYGDPASKDVETPVAKVVGEVDVAVMDHHGNRDAVNEFQVKALKPRVWIGQTWSADHPGHEVLIRMTTPYLYSEPRDIFSTNMLEANRIVIGPLIDRSYKSQQGHILVRVLPGGETYYVIILDDSKKDMPVKAVFGPYQSKKK
ncbi:MAG: hypothetical protein P0Y53_23675 [Candidatus Pseudobacter hemicellulosilyticus]|uniref:Beta-lactamase superfamily II metal-dependent hydrolase n=1 Tax=Candidatus Pseudobacter hemicellulosilyticus TaxID=3121375 RepID=A0AAJ5WTS9_9BACT|nr:MAG: hypothetical protein P0Y53_23675 [Pseudobacter sp.]